MRGNTARIAQWSALAVACLLVAWGAYWVLDNQHLNGQALTTVGTVGAALFTGVAALAALRAAQQSRDTARDAAEALGVASRPVLEIGVSSAPMRLNDAADWRCYVQLKNASIFDATDLTIEARLMDGRVVSKHVDRLPGGTGTRSEPVYVDVGKAPKVPIEGMDRVVVQFSDARGAARWEQTYQEETRIEPHFEVPGLTVKTGIRTSVMPICESSFRRIR